MNISPLAQASLRQPFCDVGTHLPFLFFTYFLPFLPCSQKQPDTVCIVQIGGPLSKSLHASWQEVPCCFHSWRLGHLGVAGHLKIGISHPSSEVPVTSSCCPSLQKGGSFIVQSVGGHLKIGVSQPSSEVFLPVMSGHCPSLHMAGDTSGQFLHSSQSNLSQSSSSLYSRLIAGVDPSRHIGGSVIVQSVGGRLKIGVSQPSSEVS